MIKNFDAKTKSTRIGNTKIDLSQITEPKKAIEGLSNQTANILGDLTKKYDLTNMTVSSLARKPIYNIQTDPHRFADSPLKNPGGGKGIDITYMKSKDGREALFQDKPLYDKKGNIIGIPDKKMESSLAQDVTDYLSGDKRVNQIFTPWQMIDKLKGGPPDTNNCRNDPYNTKTLDFQHNSHIHIGSYK